MKKDNALNILEIRDLTISFKKSRSNFSDFLAVDSLNLSLKKGEIIGLVGESGSGKSVTAISIMNLIKDFGGIIKSGKIMYQQQDLLQLTDRQMQKIRGNKISFISQEPMVSFNPVKKMGKQLQEVLNLHGFKSLSTKEKNNKICDLLLKIGFNKPDIILNKYPFELSGGMCQRMMIAQSVLCNPDLIIADEPTTALDVTTQKTILNLLKNISKEYNTTVLIITHDLGIVAEICDTVNVMYAGKLVETCSKQTFFTNAKHPYSKGIIEANPHNFDKRFKIIKGNIDKNIDRSACVFSKRCDLAQQKCFNSQPSEKLLEHNHKVACFYTEQGSLEC